MSEHALEDTAAIVRGAEPAPATTVLRHMVFGSGLTHSLDYVVLLHMLFALEEDRPVTVKDLWLGLQAEGVRSAKNAKALVGRDAVYQSVNRLITAGFVRRVEDGGKPGQFGSVRYEVYRQPAYNPDFMPVSEPWRPEDDPASPLASPQVGPLPGTPEAEDAEKPRIDKTAGRTASRNAGSGNAVSGVPGSGGSRIPAGRTASGVPGTGEAFPPTPPQEEVETSSPSSPPRIPTARTSQTEGEEEIRAAQDPARVHAAAEFLAGLPGRWACGLRTTRELAPLLADVTAVQGWNFTLALTAKLTENPPEKIHSLKAFLKGRIEDLPRQSAGSAAAGPAADRCPYHPGRDAATCPPCRAGDAPTPDAERNTDPAAVEAARASARQAAQRRGKELDDFLAPPVRRPRPPRSRRGRAAARQAAQVRGAEEFEQRRAQALKGLEEHFPEAGDQP
ncbi:hypothetical protein [Streptomyces sp. MP131-18]|uniref:hypothetical protein n=1 Tax=Streptomyces sp. MP131-18 TaxID=1857892 RepID=UPI00097C3E5A|nr:hypothetical protein [Streptomyces sp. MP131-18]ONK09256.1 hypothetical protein STBA_71110 [Streptomyces sp. MP131-18]